MAELVAEKSGRTVALDLYLRLCVALSTHTAHPTVMNLLRHVDSEETTVETPVPVWTRRAALHTADACMAVLAVDMVEQAGRRSTLLRAYADAHLGKTLAPMATILGGAVLRGLRRGGLPGTLRQMVRLRRYYRSGRAARDPYDERKAKTIKAIATILARISGEDLPAAELIVDYFAEDLARSVET
jgi:hypothetical protein